MKRDHTTTQTIAEARELRATRECDWHDYERFKRQLATALGYGDEYDRAIDQLTEALGL